MTTVVTPSNFKKEYMTGYTGHVPTKADFFGASAGNIQRQILDNKGRSSVYDQTPQEFHTLQMYSGVIPPFDKNKIIFGNHSRFARNWVCGPNHMINEQRIPGYTGHIKGMQSENLCFNSYGQITAKAFTKRHPIGHDLGAQDKY
jgi:hypothetical protein